MSNAIQFRRVIVRTVNSSGGFSETETWEYRAKNIVAAALGLIPLEAAWSNWTRIAEETVVQDQNGNPLA